MMKLLDKLLLLVLVAIINYPSASNSLVVHVRACAVSNHCIGWNYCGWTFFGYRKSCCVNQRCSCKESIYDTAYCDNFEVETRKDFENLCACFPNSCNYLGDTDKMIKKCVNYLNRNAFLSDELISSDPGWWNRQILYPPRV